MIEEVLGIACWFVVPEEQHPGSRHNEQRCAEEQRGDRANAEQDVQQQEAAEGTDDTADYVEEVVSFETKGAALAVVDTVRIGDAQFTHGVET